MITFEILQLEIYYKNYIIYYIIRGFIIYYIYNILQIDFKISSGHYWTHTLSELWLILISTHSSSSIIVSVETSWMNAVLLYVVVLFRVVKWIQVIYIITEEKTFSILAINIILRKMKRNFESYSNMINFNCMLYFVSRYNIYINISRIKIKNSKINIMFTLINYMIIIRIIVSTFILERYIVHIFSIYQISYQLQLKSLCVIKSHVSKKHSLSTFVLNYNVKMLLI